MDADFLEDYLSELELNSDSRGYDYVSWKSKSAGELVKEMKLADVTSVIEIGKRGVTDAEQAKKRNHGILRSGRYYYRDSSDETIDEVVVIGYGSTTRKDMTGSISSLDTKIIESSAAPNLAQMIQGQIPGLNIMLGDGSPGSPSRLEIRGASTLSSNSGPLIVVDDVPMSPDYDINMINSADIKSLNVLKGVTM